jgi:hypothetical protein
MIVGIVTSVNYDDLLRLTLPTTCGICDVVYVLTAEGDASIQVARDNGTKVMEYNGWQEQNACFNKSGALSTAQEHVHEHHPSAWVILADADMILPPTLRQSILDANDHSALYSIARVDYKDPQAYREGKASYYAFPFSGYCQIYRSETKKTYPPWSKNAGLCDCFFRDKFSTWIRHPGVASHLGREHVNWQGRKSERWVL